MNDTNEAAQTTRYLPTENAQLTKIHSDITDRVSDELIRLQDATAVLYQTQIDRLLDALADLMKDHGPQAEAGARIQARTLLKEMRP
jgi:hypothetical protein